MTLKSEPCFSVFKTFVAVLIEFEATGRAMTVDAVMDRLGAQSKSYVSVCLQRLRSLGWVAMERGACATIRPLRRLELWAG
jgi:SOS-response transcriptional repressor LexA